MKRIFSIIAFAIIITFFVSCGKKTVYQQRHDFTDYTWERLTDSKKVTFNNIEIEDTSSVYDIYVTLRHAPFINVKDVKFVMRIIYPDGITRESIHDVQLMDRYGKNWVGDAMGDYIDLEEKCRSFVSFPAKGKYTITLTNMGMYSKTTGIMDIGIKIKKSDIESYKTDN